MSLCITLVLTPESYTHINNCHLPLFSLYPDERKRPYLIFRYSTISHKFTSWKSSHKPQGFIMCLSAFDAFMVCPPEAREAFHKSLKKVSKQDD